MLTIDWKERLTKDTASYMQNKFPKCDYDFEIIFNAYPERINGKIPAEVIVHVVHDMIHIIGRQHEQYLPFFNYLCEKKGDYGKVAFTQFMNKYVPKKPAVYIPLVEKAILKFNHTEIASLFEKVFFPLLKKSPHEYLPIIYKWTAATSETIHKQAINLLLRLIKKRPELIGDILTHFQHQWDYPITDGLAYHALLLKAVGKIDFERYINVYREYHSSRDPQTIDILCMAIYDYHPELEQIVDAWTHSGNARIKKTALTAQKILHKKKS